MQYLVTGANGHLGNNVVRELLKDDKKVKASVRDTSNTKPFVGLDCEIVYVDILNKQSLLKAFKGVDILYHVAAVFKHWAKNPKEEILQANLIGTKNVLEAAAEMGIKKIIYVSSIAALDFSKPIVDENSWGNNFPNHYFKSKNDAEKLAWQLAKELKLRMITILPSGMIGPQIFNHFTPAMNLLNNIINNKLQFDPQYEINYVHVQDVAQGMMLAEKYGKVGERYILGNKKSINTTEAIKLAHKLYPDVQIPRKASKILQLFLASMMWLISKINGKPPLLLIGNIFHYYKRKVNLNIQKAREELDFKPRPAEQALIETFKYLKIR